MSFGQLLAIYKPFCMFHLNNAGYTDTFGLQVLPMFKILGQNTCVYTDVTRGNAMLSNHQLLGVVGCLSVIL